MLKGGRPSPYADTITRLMQERGISGRSLSAKAGLGLDAVRNITRGRSAFPSAATMQALAEALDVPLDTLYGRDAEPASSSPRGRPTPLARIPIVDIDRVETARTELADRATGEELVLPKNVIGDLADTGLAYVAVTYQAAPPLLASGDWILLDTLRLRLSTGGLYYLVSDGLQVTIMRTPPSPETGLPDPAATVLPDGWRVVARIIGVISAF